MIDLDESVSACAIDALSIVCKRCAPGMTTITVDFENEDVEELYSTLSTGDATRSELEAVTDLSTLWTAVILVLKRAKLFHETGSVAAAAMQLPVHAQRFLGALFSTFEALLDADSQRVNVTTLIDSMKNCFTDEARRNDVLDGLLTLVFEYRTLFSYSYMFNRRTGKYPNQQGNTLTQHLTQRSSSKTTTPAASSTSSGIRSSTTNNTAVVVGREGSSGLNGGFNLGAMHLSATSEGTGDLLEDSWRDDSVADSVLEPEEDSYEKEFRLNHNSSINNNNNTGYGANTSGSNINSSRGNDQSNNPQRNNINNNSNNNNNRSNSRDEQHFYPSISAPSILPLKPISQISREDDNYGSDYQPHSEPESADERSRPQQQRQPIVGHHQQQQQQQHHYHNKQQHQQQQQQQQQLENDDDVGDEDNPYSMSENTILNSYYKYNGWNNVVEEDEDSENDNYTPHLHVPPRSQRVTRMRQSSANRITAATASTAAGAAGGDSAEAKPRIKSDRRKKKKKKSLRIEEGLSSSAATTARKRSDQVATTSNNTAAATAADVATATAARDVVMQFNEDSLEVEELSADFGIDSAVKPASKNSQQPYQQQQQQRQQQQQQQQQKEYVGADGRKFSYYDDSRGSSGDDDSYGDSGSDEESYYSHDTNTSPPMKNEEEVAFYNQHKAAHDQQHLATNNDAKVPPATAAAVATAVNTPRNNGRVAVVVSSLDSEVTAFDSEEMDEDDRILSLQRRQKSIPATATAVQKRATNPLDASIEGLNSNDSGGKALAATATASNRQFSKPFNPLDASLEGLDPEKIEQQQQQYQQQQQQQSSGSRSRADDGWAARPVKTSPAWSIGGGDKQDISLSRSEQQQQQQNSAIVRLPVASPSRKSSATTATTTTATFDSASLDDEDTESPEDRRDGRHRNATTAATTTTAAAGGDVSNSSSNGDRRYNPLLSSLSQEDMWQVAEAEQQQQRRSDWDQSKSAVNTAPTAAANTVTAKLPKPILKGSSSKAATSATSVAAPSVLDRLKHRAAQGKQKRSKTTTAEEEEGSDIIHAPAAMQSLNSSSAAVARYADSNSSYANSPIATTTTTAMGIKPTADDSFNNSNSSNSSPDISPVLPSAAAANRSRSNSNSSIRKSVTFEDEARLTDDDNNSNNSSNNNSPHIASEENKSSKEATAAAASTSTRSQQQLSKAAGIAAPVITSTAATAATAENGFGSSLFDNSSSVKPPRFERAHSETIIQSQAPRTQTNTAAAVSSSAASVSGSGLELVTSPQLKFSVLEVPAARSRTNNNNSNNNNSNKQRDVLRSSAMSDGGSESGFSSNNDNDSDSSLVNYRSRNFDQPLAPMNHSTFSPRSYHSSNSNGSSRSGVFNADNEEANSPLLLLSQSQQWQQQPLKSLPANFEMPPLSEFAIETGVIVEGWLQKKGTGIMGRWQKRYCVLSESSSAFCVLRLFSGAVRTAYGVVPVGLKASIPLVSIEAVDTVNVKASKGKEFKIKFHPRTTKSTAAATAAAAASSSRGGSPAGSETGSVMSDATTATAAADGTKETLLQAEDAETRLLWVTMLSAVLNIAQQEMT